MSFPFWHGHYYCGKLYPTRQLIATNEISRVPSLNGVVVEIQLVRHHQTPFSLSIGVVVGVSSSRQWRLLSGGNGGVCVVLMLATLSFAIV